jgi:two-component system CheB/CheR fusion protein
MLYLIDDDLHIRRAFELLLKSVDMPYQSFQNAEEFLASAALTEKDVLVLDLNLPGISGTELLMKLSKAAQKINVIVVTAYDEPLIRGHCKEYGVKAYLRKPVDSEALIDIIRYSVPT